MTSQLPDTRGCAFCGRAVSPWLELPRQSGHACLACATRLGRLLLDAPLALAATWPTLIEQDSDEPEPRVRLPDGRMVELREHTAELKRELTVEARLELAGTYGQIGLFREQILECGYVLSTEPALEIAQRALTLLLMSRFTAPDAVSRLRSVLFPG